SLKVREFSREDERKLRIVFDNPPRDAISATTYEEAVALTASLGWHFSALNTDITFVAPGFAGKGIYDFLSYLAVVEPGEADSAIDQLPLSDDYNLIVTTRPRGTIPTVFWACSYFVFVGPK